MDIAGKRIALIGGAGLLGSHIADQLLQEDVAQVIVFDNFLRGTRTNLESASRDPRLKVVAATMTDEEALRDALTGVDGVFLLASLWLGECVNEPRPWDVERRRSMS